MTDALVLDQPSALPPSASAIADEAQLLVHDLRRRVAAAESNIAAMPAKRQPLAFKAAQGDRRARTKLAELATAEAVARREQDDLLAALTEARRRLEAARSAERKELAEAQVATAHLLADAFVAESAKIDRALADIALAHQRRAELRLQLAATGCVENLSHLDCSIRLRLAIARAGVFGILCPGVNAPSRDDRISLAASDRRTLSRMRGDD